MKLYFIKAIFYAGDPPEGDTRPQYEARYSQVFTELRFAEDHQHAYLAEMMDSLDFMGSEIICFEVGEDESQYPGVW